MDLSDCQQPSRVLCFPVWLSKESPSGPGAGRALAQMRGDVGAALPAPATCSGTRDGADSEAGALLGKDRRD